MWTCLAGLLLLAQFAGLQQYCLCGSCAVSQVLGVQAGHEAHLRPCCARRAHAAAVAAARDPKAGIHGSGCPCGCGAGAHALRGAPAVEHSMSDLREPARGVLALVLPAIGPSAVRLARACAAIGFEAGGGGGSLGPPIYLRTLSLRI